MTPLPNLSRLPFSDDLGLGTRTGPGRSVNKDGTFNVRRVGVPVFRGYELYHSLITMGGFRFLGLLSFALATGLLYGRFSRPHAQMRFSRNGLVAPYRGITGFMFRFVNRRSNQLIEVEATVVFTFLEVESGLRHFVTLVLERSKINLFPTSWTVVHPIDEASPLFGLTDEDLRKAQAEFIVLIKAFDDTFSQSIYQRTSYTAEEVLWGVRFRPMAAPGADGMLEMDVDLVDATETV